MTASANRVAVQTTPRDLCRVVILRKDGFEFLLWKAGEHFSFPVIEIPHWERPTENINARVQNLYGISAHCLFSPEISSPDPRPADQRILCQVMEADSDTAPEPEGMIWAPAVMLADCALATPNDVMALASTRQQLALQRDGSAANSLSRPGWLRELLSWVEQEITPLGLHLKSRVRQLSSGAGFALVRLETDGPAVWFKATAGPHRHEQAVSRALSKFFSDFTPRIIAAHAGWNGWLTMEADGPLLASDRRHENWYLAAEAFSCLEIKSVGMALRLLDAGCKDTRICCLEPQIGPFLEVMTDLMARQRKVPPYPLDRSELTALGEQIKWLCQEVAELSLPDTLGHLDLNPGNIVTTKKGPVFLDWAEACVGCPLVSFEYLRCHFLRKVGIDGQAKLSTAYLTNWEHFLGAGIIAKASRFAPLLAVFTLAVSSIAWHDAEEIRRPVTAGYLRSLARRMKHEADELNNRRSRCNR